MSKIIRAKVLTSSSDDDDCRVKLTAPLTWDESPLTRSVGGLPLKVGDYVYVDISDGLENPLIIGKCVCGASPYSKTPNGSVLWDSVDGVNWSIAFVNGGDLEIYNSNGFSIKINGKSFDIQGADIQITQGSVDIIGTVTPSGTGGWSCITACPFSGAVHVGNKLTTTP